MGLLGRRQQGEPPASHPQPRHPMRCQDPINSEVQRRLRLREVAMTTLRGWMLLTVLALSGCALAEVHIKPPEAGLETPIPGGNQRQIIVAIPFQDARQSMSR